MQVTLKSACPSNFLSEPNSDLARAQSAPQDQHFVQLVNGAGPRAPRVRRPPIPGHTPPRSLQESGPQIRLAAAGDPRCWSSERALF